MPQGTYLALPFIILNMGGEMIYILHQRLQAQNVDATKSKKVLADVIKTMFKEDFMRELFVPQVMYTQASTKQVM